MSSWSVSEPIRIDPHWPSPEPASHRKRFLQQISYRKTAALLDCLGDISARISVPEWDRQFVSLVSTTNTARSLAGFDLLALALTRCFSRQSYFTGIRTGASLSLSKTTKNLAGIVLLALRPTV